MIYVWLALGAVGLGGVVLLVKGLSETSGPKVGLMLECAGEQSRHAMDNVRVDVCLKIDLDLTACHDPSIISPSVLNAYKDLVLTKTREALATALKSESSDFYMANQATLIKRLKAAYGETPEGVVVSWEIERLELTPLSFYDPLHILDSDGLRLLTDRKMKAERAENDARRKKEIEDAKRAAE